MTGQTKNALKKETSSNHPHLPLDYVVYGSHIVIQVIEAENQGPQEAFLSQTEKRLKKNNKPISLRSLGPEPSKPNQKIEGLSGLIFHTSRCGSTLLCNMLDHAPNCITIRESTVLNKVIHDDDLTPSQKIHLFRTLVEMYVHYTDTLSANCVIKFSSHCALQLSFITSALAGTPWVYVHRDLSEVLNSLVSKPAPWMKETIAQHILKSADMNRNGIQATATILKKGVEEIAAYKHKHKHKHKSAMLISYPDIVETHIDTLSQLMQLFNIAYKPAHLALMGSCLAVDSKTGKQHKKGTNQTNIHTGLSSSELTGLNNTYLKLLRIIQS